MADEDEIEIESIRIAIRDRQKEIEQLNARLVEMGERPEEV